MNQLVVETTAIANFGPFDPSDAQSGDVLFLDSDRNVFATLDALVTAPVPPAMPEMQAATSRRAEPDLHRDIGPALAAGAILQTDKGEVAAQDLLPGQRILTRNKGFQTVQWVARRQVTAAEMTAQPDLRPVLISAGALGPNAPSSDLCVPGCQRLMVEGPRTKLMFGAKEVFVLARHLVGYPGITHGAVADITYVHAMCHSHEVIWADGIWTESFQPTAAALTTLTADQSRDMTGVLSQSGDHPDRFSAARMTLERHEADLLLA